MFDHDPRTFPDPAAAPPEVARLHALVAQSMAAATALDAAALDAQVVAALHALLAPGGGKRLAEVFATAPGAAVGRHLWRLLVQCERATGSEDGLGVTLFAMPLVIIAGIEAAPAARTAVSGVIEDAAALAAILREHGALAGNQSFALANVLVAASAIDVACLPDLLARRALPQRAMRPLDLEPAAMPQVGGQEGVHLRFLVGTALAAPGADLLQQGSVGAWGLPFTQAIGRQLAAPGLPVLALPRAPQPLAAALQQGRMAHREVAAQVFASNAIRRLRASVGEPTAVLSMHRAPDAPGGGEIRLSLSSAFDARAAEGFRCPLFPFDRVPDVATMLTDLLRDCRVADVRIVPGVHADRDVATGLPLLFKGENLPESAAQLH